MTTEPVVYVVDDDAEVCNSLRSLIESVGFRVATYPSAREFLNQFDAQTPGCLVLDVQRPEYDGLDFQQRIIAGGIGLPVVIITGRSDDPAPIRANSIQDVDVIEVPYDEKLVLDRVRQAVESDIRNRTKRAERSDIVARFALLTARERQVLDAIVNGCSNSQIAEALGISTRTVETHRAHVMQKTRAESLAGLIHLAQIVGINEHTRPTPGTQP